MTTKADADFKHGYSGYKRHGCRCYTCGYANAQYYEARERAIAYGNWQPYVDAAPVREHLRNLMNAGIGWRRIAELSGASANTIKNLLYGRGTARPAVAERIRPETAERILAVQPSTDALCDMTNMDATGFRRRIQALVAVGYPQAYIAQRLNIRQSNLRADAKQVTAARHRCVVALYDELSGRSPIELGVSENSANRARIYAQRHRWAPPAAWDDDRLDDPQHRPGGRPAWGRAA